MTQVHGNTSTSATELITRKPPKDIEGHLVLAPPAVMGSSCKS